MIPIVQINLLEHRSFHHKRVLRDRQLIHLVKTLEIQIPETIQRDFLIRLFKTCYSFAAASRLLNSFSALFFVALDVVKKPITSSNSLSMSVSGSSM